MDTVPITVPPDSIIRALPQDRGFPGAGATRRQQGAVSMVEDTLLITVREERGPSRKRFYSEVRT